MLIFRQLFDPASSTYTYLLGDSESREALLIDPVFEQAQRDTALLAELDLQLTSTLETHIHADHITGASLLKDRCGAQICAAKIANAQGVDVSLEHGDRVSFGRRHILVRATPGHTNGCLTFVLDDESMAFTGDCLLIRGCGRTDFQQGDARRLYQSVHLQIFTLPEHCLLYPGHDYKGLMVTSVREERAFNPRLGGQISEDDFTGYMANMRLAHPKQIDAAVPANMRCGRRDEVADAQAVDALSSKPWARLNYTFAGFWEIDAAALDEVAEQVQLLDVREEDEYEGTLGHIAGTQLIPLGELAGRLDELQRSKPVVCVCRAGSRSAQAITILRDSGFSQLANLAGGMLGWRAGGYPVQGGAD